MPKYKLNLKHFKMQIELDVQSVSQVPEEQLGECQALPQVPIETKETSTDRGAIKDHEDSDKLINSGATEEKM